jgi:hypothetical protein
MLKDDTEEDIHMNINITWNDHGFNLEARLSRINKSNKVVV